MGTLVHNKGKGIFGIDGSKVLGDKFSAVKVKDGGEFKPGDIIELDEEYAEMLIKYPDICIWKDPKTESVSKEHKTENIVEKKINTKKELSLKDAKTLSGGK